MKKLFIGSILIASAVALTSAEEGGVRPMPVNAPMPGVKAVKAVLASSTMPQMMGDEMRALLTGNKEVDDKIKALVQERDQKLKAIHEEFQTKLKALVGERKLIRASTTEKMKEMKDDMRERMKNASGTPVNASGTPMRPPMASGTPPMMQNQMKPKAPNPVKRFFQSFLGFNAQELQAEEIR